jgi:hypothetical protein
MNALIWDRKSGRTRWALEQTSKRGAQARSYMRSGQEPVSLAMIQFNAFASANHIFQPVENHRIGHLPHCSHLYMVSDLS